jgi:hypothetical protein
MLTIADHLEFIIFQIRLGELSYENFICWDEKNVKFGLPTNRRFFPTLKISMILYFCLVTHRFFSFIWSHDGAWINNTVSLISFWAWGVSSILIFMRARNAEGIVEFFNALLKIG